MSNTEKIADLFQNHREELGFVNRAQCREGETYTVFRDDSLVGAALCNHCVQKPQTTLYDIAVCDSYKRCGIGEKLIQKIYKDSPHDKIVAKCPRTLPAVQFYAQTGWELITVEDGKSRSLTVWEYHE